MKLDLSNTKGVIFDIDGTLLDSMPIWQDVSCRYLRNHGIEPEENLSKIVFSMSLKEGVQYVRERYHLPQSQQEIEDGVVDLIRTFYYEEAVAKPGVEEVLDYFSKRKIPMILVTTGDEDLASHALQRLGLYDRFIALLTCDMFQTSKREPKIFGIARKMLEDNLKEKQKMPQADDVVKIPHAQSTEAESKITNMQEENRNYIVVEDSATSLRTAKGLGFFTVGILDDASREYWDEIRDLADVCVRNLKEL